MRRSGRSLERVAGGRSGRSQEGRRVAETPSGRQDVGEASMMVNHDVGVEDERVRWRRRSARLWREIYAEIRVGWEHLPSQCPIVSLGGGAEE